MKRTKYNSSVDNLGLVEITQTLPKIINFEGLEFGSQHKIITPPKGQKNWTNGVWIQGTVSPVKLLFSDFKQIKK